MGLPPEIAPDLAYLQTSLANVYFAGTGRGWVLIDTGVVGFADSIRTAAAARFGANSRPDAIVLTHGHYDHAANARELAAAWDVPIYAHRLEFPYLTGRSPYPQKDPTVGGAMGFLSRFFPNRTVNAGPTLRALPDSGEVPGLPDWKAIFTPGHAPGHVCLWRERDAALVAGDVVATADLDSWRGIAGGKKKISRPPSPFTYDWEKARTSVELIASLKPFILASGHGVPMTGSDVATELERFAKEFRVPEHGRYAEAPARVDETGVVYEPPAPADHVPRLAAGVVAGVFVLAGVVYRKRGQKAKRDLV